MRFVRSFYGFETDLNKNKMCEKIILFIYFVGSVWNGVCIFVNLINCSFNKGSSQIR